ncbi:hypothetical protein SAMN05880501_103105 [Ureibacillus xyleni]|uniref:SH3 domain-containing protein n=1 Tax=Ureibacillus xyleni TaxID=614648 RepID=A0A285S6A9_9BACL|nr:hypothetical protein [Ureibacillus xyleni]SOC02776.1 hypothetical protein SAMN05880501_103105 [Ureibacillus xyleni]
MKFSKEKSSLFLFLSLIFIFLLTQESFSKKVYASDYIEATLIEDVNVYVDLNTNSEVIKTLPKGMKVQTWGSGSEWTRVKLDDVPHFAFGNVETKFLKFPVTTPVEQTHTNDWIMDEEQEITGNEEVIQPVPQKEPAKKYPTKSSYRIEYTTNDYTDTYAEAYTAKVDTKVYSALDTKSKVVGTFKKGETLHAGRENDDFVYHKVIAFQKDPKFIHLRNEDWDVYGFVLRKDIATHYVFKTPKGKNYNYNYSQAFANYRTIYPRYRSADASGGLLHDPIYDLLPVGTKVLPSPVTAGSIVKPKYGLGASTIKHIPSKGSAKADGWVGATVKSKYNLDWKKTVNILTREVGFSVDDYDWQVSYPVASNLGIHFVDHGSSGPEYKHGQEYRARIGLTAYRTNLKEEYRKIHKLREMLKYFVGSYKEADKIINVYKKNGEKENYDVTIKANGYKVSIGSDRFINWIKIYHK